MSRRRRRRKSNRSAIATLAVGVVIIALALLGSQTGSSDIWFDDVKRPLELSTDQGETLVRVVSESLAQGNSAVNEVPDPLVNDDQARIVFLSVSDGQSHAWVVIGAARGLVPAIEQALSRLQATLPVGFRPEWVKLDIVDTVRPPQTVRSNTHFSFERSLEGLAFERESHIAFLPEELVAHTLVDSGGDVQFDNITWYLEARRPPTETSTKFDTSSVHKARRFTTRSFFYNGKQAFPLYRGHRLIDDITSEDLLTAAQRAGAYLTRSVNRDGKFIYIYLPKSNRVLDEYNLIRHAGSVYAMLELYQVTQEKELLSASTRAIDYLLQYVKPWGEAPKSAALVSMDGAMKLGGTALTAVALAKYVEVTHDQQYMPLLQQLGQYIEDSQLDNGRFISERAYPSGEISDYESRYYPGESLLALVRLYALDGQEHWLDTAEKGSKYLIKVRDQGVPMGELIHDHWLLYALNELYRYRPNPMYLEHAMLIAQAISQSQNRIPQYPDYRGSYYTPPRSTATATRTEGLVAAYKLARDYGRKEDAQSILTTIRLNIMFQLQTQFQPESVLYISDPQRALGAFHKSLTNFEIRNDYVQHNISSILGVYQILTGG